MTVTELLKEAQFLVDGEGKKKAVLLNFSLWEELLTLLEDLEDSEEIQYLRASGEESIPWDQAKVELKTAGIIARR